MSVAVWHGRVLWRVSILGKGKGKSAARCLQLKMTACAAGKRRLMHFTSLHSIQGPDTNKTTWIQGRPSRVTSKASSRISIR